MRRVGPPPIVDRIAVVLAAGFVVSVAVGLGFYSPASSRAGSSPCIGPLPTASTPIQHVFFLIKENHAFENYFGTFPGVVGGPPNGNFATGGPTSRTVHPFPLNRSSTLDLPHDRAALVSSWDGGLNDAFVSTATSAGYPNAVDAVGYYTAKQIPQYFAYARNYALGDRFFVGQMGPTLPNRIFDLAGTAANWTTNANPPPGVLNIPTLLDQLAGVCLPWNYLYAPGSGRVTALLFPSITSNPDALGRVLPVDHLGSLLSGPNPPAVTYIDPSPNDNVSEHPPGNVSMGADWSAGVIDTIFTSPIANSSAVFLYYDENGGFWDPVNPPVQSSTGDGFRVPLLVLSPFTPRGVIDHQTLDPNALLRFVDDNFHLPYLSATVGSAPALTGFFDFRSPGRAPVLLPSNFTTGFQLAHRSLSSTGVAPWADLPSSPTYLAPVPVGPIRAELREFAPRRVPPTVIYPRSDSEFGEKFDREFPHRTPR